MFQQLNNISRSQTVLLVALAALSIVALLWPHPQPAPIIPAPVRAAAVPPVIPVPTKTPTDKSTTVLELFNPSDQSVTHQINETNVSQQVEQVMTTSYILVHCQLMNNDEYRDNFRALIVFAEHNKLAPDAVTAEVAVRKIAASAAGSYSLLYSRINCSDPQLPPIKRQMMNWQNIYLHQ